MPSPLRSGSREMTLPSHVVSFHETSLKGEDDGDSCMDLCSSSDDSVGVVAKKLSPAVTAGLQQKLKLAKGIFGTAPKRGETIDLCSPTPSYVDDGSNNNNNRPRKRKVFDQVYHIGERGGDESYEKRPMRPAMLLLSGSEHSPSSSAGIDAEWIDFGVFSSMQNESVVMSLRDVRPAFSPSELSFFTDMKLCNVEDLKRADTNALGVQLLESLDFRKACAFFAWKDGKPLRNYLRFTVARNTVVKWKKLVQKNSKGVTKKQSVNNMNDAEANKQTLPAEKTEAKDIPLTNLLSGAEARMLRDHFGIETATQLINEDGQRIRQTLSGIIAYQFDGRSSRELECICEGMLFSWVLRSREAMESIESTATTMETSKSCDTMPESLALLSSEDEQNQQPKIQTPLSYVDFLFLEQQGISTDHELSLIDPSLLTRDYTAFLKTKDRGITHVDANKEMKRLRHEASLVCSGVSVPANPPQRTRLDLSNLPKSVMHNATNLCRTAIDENNNGLPKKTLIVYDDQNFVLYEFLVSIDDSSIPNSGKGTFLTFKGAKVLKKKSQWKSKYSSKSLRTPVTRTPREALFASSGATITLKGTDLHGDECHYETEKKDSVGIWNEFTKDDFVETDSNITFSSMHVGCALIELDRYAPLIPSDRKTEFIFGMKDFLFSHEPASWRFDVKEKLNGESQVVDFTDDTTGSPHAVARANTAMYVNECGHDIDLVENVCSLETCRSVSYYIYIDKPMEAGETRELLINYREKYEEIRERRGYGLANVHHGIKGDEDGVSRILRNQKERLPTEATIMSCSEEEIRMLVNFIKGRVLSGVIEATSHVRSDADMDVLVRQFVARRRIHWLSKLCETRLLELIGNQKDGSLSDDDDDDDSIFYKGMLVFVHGWIPKHDPRPPYTGLATIISISKDKFGRHRFELSLPQGKYIEDVPAAAVTIPEENDFVDAPNRLRLNWVRSRRDRHLPHIRRELLLDLSSMEWNPSFGQYLPHLARSIQTSLKWELAEEVLFKATKDKSLMQPLHEVVTKIALVIEKHDNHDSFYEELCDVAGLPNKL